ncbi:MAG: FKBP-type peptidyl-prolyl cis-trans isomerase [Gemmatimonadota bacterium]
MSHRFHRLMLVLCLTGACSSGKSSVPTPAPAPPVVAGEPEKLRFSPQLGVDLQFMRQTASGLYYLDSQLGKGAAAQPGSRVRVAYQGWLADGTLFDANAQGYQFLLGRRMVIPGWDEGIAGMKPGGHRLLVIRPSLAYGSRSPGAGIPPNATLVFEVRLISVQ